jgi:hypothetical protein
MKGMADFNPFMRETKEALGNSICASLLSNGYKTAVYAPFAADAAKIVLGMIPDRASVGVPGTVTIRQLGLMEKLALKNCAVHHHWDPGLAPENREKRLKDEIYSDWYVTSSNAITYGGVMVNIDGTGNRVAAMAWSTGRIIYVVSVNKAAPDLESALARARNTATPANALRVGKRSPCTQIGRCVNCDSPERTCRAVLIMERVPFGREAHVVLVGEDLGY